MFGIAGCQSDETAPPDDDEQEQDEFGIGIAYHIGGTDDTVEFWSIAVLLQTGTTSLLSREHQTDRSTILTALKALISLCGKDECNIR